MLLTPLSTKYLTAGEHGWFSK